LADLGERTCAVLSLSFFFGHDASSGSQKEDHHNRPQPKHQNTVCSGLQVPTWNLIKQRIRDVMDPIKRFGDFFKPVQCKNYPLTIDQNTVVGRLETGGE
jgi:hypothetical protein